jgi:hypothetical protein
MEPAGKEKDGDSPRPVTDVTGDKVIGGEE